MRFVENILINFYRFFNIIVFNIYCIFELDQIFEVKIIEIQVDQSL